MKKLIMIAIVALFTLGACTDDTDEIEDGLGDEVCTNEQGDIYDCNNTGGM